MLHSDYTLWILRWYVRSSIADAHLRKHFDFTRFKPSLNKVVPLCNKWAELNGKLGQEKHLARWHCPRQAANLCPSLRWCNEAITQLPTQRFLNFCWAWHLRRSLDQEVFIQALTSAVTEPEAEKGCPRHHISPQFLNLGKPMEALNSPGLRLKQGMTVLTQLIAEALAKDFNMSVAYVPWHNLAETVVAFDLQNRWFLMVILGCDMGVPLCYSWNQYFNVVKWLLPINRVDDFSCGERVTCQQQWA